MKKKIRHLVKLRLSRLSPMQRLAQADRSVAALTDNSYFPDPQPKVDILAAASAENRALRKKLAKLETALKVVRGEIHASDLKVNKALASLGNHVQRTSGGDAIIILGAGMDVMGQARRLGPLPAVTELSVRRADHEGHLRCRWRPIHGAFAYEIQLALKPDGPWKFATASSRCDCTLPCLTPGVKYWVRVRAIGAAGQGPWSGVACQMAV